MKNTGKYFIWLCAVLLLSLATTAAISAVEGINVESDTQRVLIRSKLFFEEWQGSLAMTVIAVLCLTFTIISKGLTKR